MSIGIEKLYKLTLGLVALDRESKWPTTAEMRKRGHALLPMHQEVWDELRGRTSSRSQYVRDLLAEVDSDPVVVPVIEALDTYGRQGRFYYLDRLGEDPQAVSPDDTWQRIEQTALTDPSVAALYERAMTDVGDSDAWERFVRALHERIATAVEHVWVTIAVCGRNNALGETGAVFGFEVHPDAVGRQ